MNRLARTVAIATTLTVAGVLGPAAYPASADETCRPVVGHLEEEQVPGEGFQARGRMVGGIQGIDNFTLLSLEEPVAGTNVSHFVGRSLIETRTGDIDTVVVGAFDTRSGKFSDLLTIVGGTGEWQGATGQIHLYGTFDLTRGTGSSDYRGEVCTR